MTEPVSTPESRPEVVSQEPPTPKFTEPSADSSTSTVDMDALAERLAARMMPTVEKLVQSQKDKRFSDIEKRLDAAGLKELEDLGVSIPDNVKQEYRFRDMQKKLEQLSAPVQEASPGRGATSDSAKVSEVIKESGLDANTPEVISLLSGQYRNIDHFTAEAYKLKMRLANRPTPDASAAPAQSGGSVHIENSEEKKKALIAKVQEWQLKPSAHKQELADAYKELGWN